MRLLLKILYFFYTWFTIQVNATPVFTKVVLPSYELTCSKTENVKKESFVKIGIQNFARNGISDNSFSQKSTSKASYASSGASRAGERKIVNGAGNLLDDIYNAQKSIINTWKNNIATATNIRKGNFGEIASDVFLAEKNFQPLHTRLQSIDAPTRQGIDGVFKKGNEYFIVESKYRGTATLSNTADGKQMSDPWINGSNRLRNAVDGPIFDAIDAAGYRRLLAEVAPDGTIVYKELDASASVIGTFTP